MRTRRCGRATCTRIPSSKASTLAREAGERLGIEVTIARPTGIYGPGDRRLLKMFRGVARGRFPMLGSGEIYYHLTYIDDLVEGFRRCARGTRRRRGGPTSSRAAEVTTPERTGGGHGRGRRRAASARAPAGLAVLGRGRGVRGPVRAVRHRAAALSPARGLLSRRAVRSTSRARARKSGTTRRSGCARASGARWSGTVSMDGSEMPMSTTPSPQIPQSPGSALQRRARVHRQKYAALVVGRPDLALAHRARARRHVHAERARARSGLRCARRLPGAARILRAQRRVRPERHPAPSAQDPHRRQRRHRRQLPAGCERGDQRRHPHRQRRVHRAEHDPVVQERRYRAGGRREHRLQLRDLLRRARVRIGARTLLAAYTYVIGGDHDLSDPSKSVLEQGRRSDRGHDRRGRLARRRRQGARRRDDRRPMPSSAPARS